MELFAALLIFWAAVMFGAKFSWRAWRRWRRARSLEVARSLSEIRNAEYYGRLSKQQFQELVLKALEARKCVLLGNPWLGAARYQGYAWKSGMKYVLVDARDKLLTARKLMLLAQQANRAKANHVLVFSPVDHAPKEVPPRLEVLYGRKLCSWFSTLDLAPPNLAGPTNDVCSCGAPAQARVSRTGRAVMSCSRYPHCKAVREAWGPAMRPLQPAAKPVTESGPRTGRVLSTTGHFPLANQV